MLPTVLATVADAEQAAGTANHVAPLLKLIVALQRDRQLATATLWGLCERLLQGAPLRPSVRLSSVPGVPGFFSAGAVGAGPLVVSVVADAFRVVRRTWRAAG
eukprot:2089989-Pyramimonas_sp.AAC.1